MTNNLITIQDASKLSGKSIQTIRRALKSKKLKFKKQKTPQGFNYMIDKLALCEIYKLNLETPKTETVSESVEKKTEAVKKVEIETTNEKVIKVKAEDFHAFARTMESLIGQHAEERQSFLRLVNTLQEKIFVLENQINLLKAPEKKWYQMWK